MADMRKAARLQRGSCISKKYLGMFVKLRWRCAKGHVFETTPNHVLNHGSWCPICYLEGQGLSLAEQREALQEMKQLARAKGGSCLSKEYKNNGTHLRWRCANGHEWLAVPGHIKHSGTWCANCATGVSERICRAVLEKIFQTDFPKKKPAWLVSERGTRMELDGYSEKLQVAFEYQGIQHFAKNTRFHSGRATLDRRQADDTLKAALCKKHGVILLQIPYTIEHASFEEYIRTLIKSKAISKNTKAVLHRTSTTEINLSTLNAYSPTHLAEMQKLAGKRGGKCLSNAYVNNQTKLQWRCKLGHIWKAAPEVIKMGHWCPDCSGNRRLTLEHMKSLARRRGGKCLAEEYHGNKIKLPWRCAKGHTWDAKPDNIKSGKWCPYCSKSPPKTLDDARTLARARGGECLSARYIDSHSKLRFRCAEGHEWKANYNNMQQGQWCPECGRKKSADNRRQNISLMHGVARKRRGLCLSREYVNSVTPLLWRCRLGHQWSAKWPNVKRGTWCPICAGRKN